MTRMIPVSFPNREGLKLFGILHEPSENKNLDNVIIILSPGIKSRVAPHRLYVKFARELSESGYKVFRFDFYGLGDSGGEIDEELTANLYGSIQLGRFSQDTISAIDWYVNNFGPQKIILFGLCGGAITALHAASIDSRIHSIISLGIPVILDNPDIDPYKYITSGQLDELRRGYLGKIFKTKAWFRFITLKSDYKIIMRSLLQPFRQKINQKVHPLKQNNRYENDNFNPLFPQIFFKFLNERKLLLLFSETDRLYWEFEEKFIRRYKYQFEAVQENIELHLIKEANHILSFKTWQQQMITITQNWLKK